MTSVKRTGSAVKVPSVCHPAKVIDGIWPFLTSLKSNRSATFVVSHGVLVLLGSWS